MRLSLSTKAHPRAYALVDDDLAKWILDRKWSVATNGYAKSGTMQGNVYLHRAVIDAAPGDHVDHINGCKLDNRRINLRIVTHAANMANTVGRSQSGYRGVTWHAKTEKWRARLDIGGKRKHLGLYEQAADAAMAVDREAVAVWGSDTFLNFPPNGVADVRKLSRAELELRVIEYEELLGLR